MRLTHIRLSGFKSFVDPTTVHVPGQLVGIVGPNGCGKSNVIDAVRWVLGESRAAALRGDSMQDVIFNGSANRAPHARSAVELVFDNSQGRAAGQWSQYAEVSVKRVLQRDGESSYFINNVHVRRRDITDIFLGTGLGPRAYAIVEQGMISRIIEAKPDELRVFLEEAAGVSRYKERRRETENRLADTRDNLARVSDIRQELGAQIERLDSQAKVASRYNEHQAELKAKQQMLWYLRRRDAAAERERHAQETAKAANELEAETTALRAGESRIETARAAHFEAGDRLNAAQAALYAANSEVARQESELRHVEETRQRLENQHAERRGQLASWREQRSQLTQALHMWAARQVGAAQRVIDTRDRFDAENGRLPQMEQEFRAAREVFTEARGRLLQAEGRLQLEQSNLAHVLSGLESLQQRGERLESELAALVQPDQHAIGVIESRIAAFDAAISEAEREVSRLQEACAELEVRRMALQPVHAEAMREHTAAEAQLATLRQVQEAAEDNAPLQSWLERQELAQLPRLWQRVRIDAGWETAVESVLRERLHALEVADGPALERLAADQPPVKAGLFCRAQGASTARDGDGPLLAARVHTTDPGADGAVADWFAGYLVCEGIPDNGARERLLPGEVLVNRKGHQFTRHSVSFHAPDPADAGILARQAEIEALAAQCETLSRAVAVARSSLAEVENEYADRQLALDAARDATSVRHKERHDAQIELLKLTQGLERYRERSAQIRDERDELAREEAAGRTRRAEIEALLAGHEQAIAACRSDLQDVKATQERAELALVAQRTAVQQAGREAQDAVFGERECASKITEIDNSVRVIDQQIERAESEIARLAAELATDPIPAVRAALDAEVETRIACEGTLAGARNAVELAAGALRELEEARLLIENRMAPLRDRIGELKLKEQAARISHDQYAAQLSEAQADESQLAEDAPRAPRASALQGDITRLNQAIGEFGAVNLAAVEELATASERKGFLDAQAADLQEAASTLEDAIRRIDRETRELLRETFESVNRHFGSLFPVLFGGGEAKLIMTGEEILDAGVQVMAHPPGKRNSTIHLLSGGEKALTAIALVFAMFQLNPAPFCLLDEVDAPLDDSNTLRFCDLVKKMAAQTQFLFISHNKITMEIAEQLIGVTMPESGVSRVVAVDIEQALRMREELAA